jgi:hypothetical protein
MDSSYFFWGTVDFRRDMDRALERFVWLWNPQVLQSGEFGLPSARGNSGSERRPVEDSFLLSPLEGSKAAVATFIKKIADEVEHAKIVAAAKSGTASFSNIWRLLEAFRSTPQDRDISFPYVLEDRQARRFVSRPAEIVLVDFGMTRYAGASILDERLHQRRGDSVRATATISARAQNEVLKAVQSFLQENVSRVDVELVTQLRFALVEKLRELIRIRFVFADKPDGSEAPSTHTWVHSFSLWTGMSPPLIAAGAPENGCNLASNRFGEDNASIFRPNLSRYRKWYYCRRLCVVRLQGCLRPRAFADRIAQPGRRARIRQSSQMRRRPLRDSRIWQVGHYVQVRPRRWA